MMKECWVICLGAGKSQVSMIRNAQSLGYYVLAIDQNSDSLGFKYADEIIVESTYNAEKILEEIDKRDKRGWIGLVARCTGQALFTAATIVKILQVPGISRMLADIATSKSALREFATRNGIKMPYGIKVTARKEYNKTGFGNNIVVKPDFTVVGKKSIRKVESFDYEKVGESIDLALFDSGNGIVEVEEFIEGYDCTYLAWLEYGEFTTILTWDELINFDESGCLYSIGISTPSISLTLNQFLKLKEVINKFAQLFPDIRTLVAFSFRVDAEGEPWLIEVHADITGDLILDKLAPASTGCNFLLEITKLLIDGKMNSGFRMKCMDLIKPTALIYGDVHDQNDETILNAQDVCMLHTKISDYLDGIVLEQQRVICI